MKLDKLDRDFIKMCKEEGWGLTIHKIGIKKEARDG